MIHSTSCEKRHGREGGTRDRGLRANNLRVGQKTTDRRGRRQPRGNTGQP